ARRICSEDSCSALLLGRPRSPVWPERRESIYAGPPGCEREPLLGSCAHVAVDLAGFSGGPSRRGRELSWTVGAATGDAEVSAVAEDLLDEVQHRSSRARRVPGERGQGLRQARALRGGQR